MDEVDKEAVLKANQSLVVIFIIGITVANAALILVAVRKKGFVSKPKWMILISLAIGDIVLALYSLVFEAKLLFDTSFRPECSVLIPAGVYQSHLIHFVYGVGLIVLAVELVVRHTSQISPPDNNEKIKAFGLSAVPWIIGLIVILPLTMAGMDWEICALKNWTLLRQRAMYGFSTCLPASAAVAACFFIICINLHPSQQQNIQHEMIATDSAPVSTPNFSSQETLDEQPIIAPEVSINADPDKERKILMLVSAVYFLCVTPYAAFILSYTLKENQQDTLSPLAFTILMETFTWLSLFRSFITPMTWIICTSY